MARKKKPARFSAIKAVKAAARETIGTPPPTRAVPEKVKKKSTEKHKAPFGRLLESDELT